MKYMLLIYQNPEAFQALPEADRQALMESAGSIMGELEASGEWVGGEALADPSTAKTVRAPEGVPAVSDGPFAESKEQLLGICIIDCESEERAIEVAARWPDARYWAMEVRALLSPDGVEM